MMGNGWTNNMEGWEWVKRHANNTTNPGNEQIKYGKPTNNTTNPENK